MNSLNIGFIGFGLIGGSIAKAIKMAHPDYKIYVTSRTLASVQPALKDGVADAIINCSDAAFTDIFGQCDYIFLCTPVVTISAYLKTLKPVIKASCIITDVGSVKGSIHKTVTELDMEKNFIGGHPMAGSERTGYVNSSAQLMVNAKYVITPTAMTDEAKLNQYIQLVKDMLSVPMVMDPFVHDYSVAGISHVPHIISATLAKLVEDNDNAAHDMHALAAGGFKDTTRIAASSPEMWDQICDSNSESICELLTKYIDLLTDVRDNINNHSEGYISGLFDSSRDYRNTFK